MTTPTPSRSCVACGMNEWPEGSFNGLPYCPDENECRDNIEASGYRGKTVERKLARRKAEGGQA